MMPKVLGGSNNKVLVRGKILDVTNQSQSNRKFARGNVDTKVINRKFFMDSVMCTPAEFN